LTLPQNLVPSADDRDHMLAHARELGKLISFTPAESADAEAQTLVIITKMLMVLPGAKSSETANEARGEAYLAALDDIAPWAVQEAVRKWYRGEHGPKFDYRWAPVPADLRGLAYAEQFRVKNRITMLERVAHAEPLLEFSEEHCARMRERLSKLVNGIIDKPPVEGATNDHAQVSR